MDALGVNGLVLEWNCSTVDCFLMQWVCTETPHLATKSSIVIDKRTYVFDGFYLLSHHAFSSPPPFEYVRENVQCNTTFVRVELPSELSSPNVRLRVSAFQDYLLWQLMRIPPSHLFPSPVQSADGSMCAAPFHIYPRFVLDPTSSPTTDTHRMGFLTGPLLSIESIMEYLDASAMSTVEMFLSEFPPDMLLHQVVSLEDGLQQGCFRIDIVTPQRQLIHDGQGASAFDGVEDTKRLARWQAAAPLLRQSPVVLSTMKVLHPSVSFLTGLRCDVFELASALPLVFQFLRYCADMDAFEARWQLAFRDKALLRQAFTHVSYIDCGLQHANSPEATLARVQMGHVFPNASPKTNNPTHETSHAAALDAITKAHVDSDFTPRSFSHFLCPYERLEYLGDAVLSFLVSSNIFLQFPDVTEGQLHDLRAKIVNNSTIGDLSKTCQLDTLVLAAFDLSNVDEDSSTKIAADCVEAVLGAIFYEQGWKDGVVSSRAFLRRLFENYDQELADFMFLLNQDVAVRVAASLDTHVESFEQHPKVASMVDLHGEFMKTGTFPIQRPHLWLQAMTHKSFKGAAIAPDEFVFGNHGNYERLEFLGDAILQVVTSRVLVDMFPNHQEDLLSSVRSSLVNNARLAKLGESLQYTRFIRFGDNVVANGLNVASVVADVFEASLAAMYLEQLDLELIEQFLQTCLFPLVHEAVSNREWMGPKQRFLSHIKQWPHTTKVNVVFEPLESREINMHAIAISVDGYVVCRAMAPTKELAADRAAAKALRLFGL
ncbi:Aste57867_13353 [Aphanomyces stellatus]|uniref:Aste57867_13353 protein n=1 Tax=Aphanomyces stellatus TaxID=120398 RepID=A0A485KY57_9STRA|nr:hypothetical protein As57867_013303 [Aphanomyces stellatus]VFT90192.1 Aste57867_13353 [Aphanomyces stellatus]